jgi:nuclease-like protein
MSASDRAKRRAVHGGPEQRQGATGRGTAGGSQTGAALCGILAPAMSHPRREQLRRLLRGGIRAVLATIALGAALPIATAGDGILAFTLVLVASGLAVASRRDLRLAARNRVGAESEAAVRRALEALTSDGWQARHAVDWPNGGDLDHVVRAASGMGFVIETKTLRYSTAHLERTARAAHWLARRRRRYPRGVLAIVCVTRLRGIERLEAGVLVVSLDCLVPALRRAAAAAPDGPRASALAA